MISIVDEKTLHEFCITPHEYREALKRIEEVGSGHKDNPESFDREGQSSGV